jgi:hypothetical protein
VQVSPPQPNTKADCEALRPEFPIPYWVGKDGANAGQAGFDTRTTAMKVVKVNARFKAICG